MNSIKIAEDVLSHQDTGALHGGSGIRKLAADFLEAVEILKLYTGLPHMEILQIPYSISSRGRAFVEKFK